MPDSLDNISVLPAMCDAKYKGQTFKLIWVLDLVTDSTRCFINLVFQNTNTHYILVDSIPPELLSYCTIGSYFRNGQKLSHSADGQLFQFKIDSTVNNRIVEAGNEFDDHLYDLSLGGKVSKYSNVCRHQLCFVQHVDGMKIIIPCLVIAATYYFKSTSLREAIMSRKIESLFNQCSLDDNKATHALISLKPGGNLGDAKYIARFILDEFAKSRLYQCKNHLHDSNNFGYSRLKVDFPVQQEVHFKVRGHLVVTGNGQKELIVFQILQEDSRFPFDSIDIEYEKDDVATVTENSNETFPVTNAKSSGRLVLESPSRGLVRHLLCSAAVSNNINEQKIVENRIPISKQSSGEVKSTRQSFDNNPTDISAQPGGQNENPVAGANIAEREQNEDSYKKPFNLDDFIKLAGTLKDYIAKDADGILIGEVRKFEYDHGLVWKRPEAKTCLNLKESYDHTPGKRRKCVYVWFEYAGKCVCLVEIDQTGLPGNGFSTQVLISDKNISHTSANSSIELYVLGKTIEARATALALGGILLRTKKHPPVDDDISHKIWRTTLLHKIASLITVANT